MAKVSVQQLRDKIAARKQAREDKKQEKYAKMRQVAEQAPEKLEKCLAGLADKYASMAEGIENLRENLGLVRPAREASIKNRVAAARNYGKAFKQIANEAPEKLVEALKEAYQSLNDIAADIEMAADQMGIELEGGELEEPTMEESAVIESPAEEVEVIEETKEANAGADAWVTDRDPEGQPKKPEVVEVPRVAGTGSDGFVTDRGKDGDPEVPSKLGADKQAMSRKDFILIADAIREFPMPVDQRRKLAVHFSHYLRGTNYNFMTNRFIDYCMGEGGPHGGDYKGPAPENKDILFEGVPTQGEAAKTRRPSPLDQLG